MKTMELDVQELGTQEMKAADGGLIPVLIVGVIVIASAAAAGISVNYVIATTK